MEWVTPKQKRSLKQMRVRDQMLLRKAENVEARTILDLYRSAIGSEFSTWNEFYPGEEEIKTDLEHNNLFVLAENGEVIGAVSIVAENELDELKCWNVSNGTTREIARVVVCNNHRGKGLAYEMVTAIEKILKERGCTTIHLLVASRNIPAYRTYLKCGYQVAGECEMYGNHYYACEKTFES